MSNSLSSMSFEVEKIIEDALAIEPRAERSLVFLDGLQALCDSLEREANCTPDGRLATHNGLVQSLVTQARVARHRELHPEVAHIAVEHPVFIIGLPRTGTTLLHNLLALHSDLRCPNLWELLNPAGERDPAQQEDAIKQAKAYVEWYYRSAPRMPTIHPMAAMRPDECQRLLGNAFRSPIYWIRYNVPSYAEWFLGQDLRCAYQFHKVQLQSILWRIPGRIPVLKDPFHIWNLEALAAIYPNARDLVLHRDPAVSVMSTCSLTATARGARSACISLTEIGLFWRDHIDKALARLPASRASAIPAHAALDIRYSDLIQDAMGTMRRVCDFLDIPLNDETAGRIREFTAENPLQKHGVHSYTNEEFGLNRNDLVERFAAYRREYLS